MAINEQSNDKTVPAVTGENTAGGEGILGKSTDWQGVHGVSVNQAGVVGDSQNFVGVWGACPKGTGVVGISTDWRGVSGESEKNAGVFGGSKEFVGVWGESPKSAGVVGKSVDWRGVDGQSEKNAGVFGYSKDFAGVWAESKTSEGIHAETWSDSRAAIAAVNQTPNGTGAALYAEKKGSIGHAGYFVGNVHVTQSITVEGDVMLQNGDCAEAFLGERSGLPLPPLPGAGYFARAGNEIDWRSDGH